MRKVSAIHKNKICTVLLVAILLIVCIPLPALASETTLTTTVPAQVSVKLEIEGNGKVEVNGKSSTESTTIEVNRHTRTEFCLTPNSGYEVKSVFLNGKNVTSELRDNIFTLEKIESSATLKVIFTPKSISPQTGDNSFLLWIYTVLTSISILGITFAIRKKYSRK